MFDGTSPQQHLLFHGVGYSFWKRAELEIMQAAVTWLD